MPIDPDPEMVADMRAEFDAFPALAGKMIYFAGRVSALIDTMADVHSRTCAGCRVCDLLRQAVSAETALRIEIGPPAEWSNAAG